MKQAHEGKPSGDGPTGAGVVARAPNVSGGDVYVRITPRAGRVDYGLSIRCSAGEGTGGAFGLGGCTHSRTTQGAPWALLIAGGLLALARRRRGSTPQ